MVKQPQSENTPFTMSSEDFPALPGTTPPSTANNSMDAGPSKTPHLHTPQSSISNSSTLRGGTPVEMQLEQRNQLTEKPPEEKKGIITHPNGKDLFQFQTLEIEMPKG